MNLKLILLLTTLSFGSVVYSQEWNFKGGHSHNDYYQERPLFDALENGMISVEADVFLQNGKLLVGHDKRELHADRTLESLYLKPLLRSVGDAKNNLPPLILMIDIKEKGDEVYAALRKMLHPYRKILSQYQNKKLSINQLTIILSGSCPVELVRSEKKRFVFIDGRMKDLNKNESSFLFPLISENWNDHFTWTGEGEISQKEFEKLQKLTEKCHQQNKMIRFWGIPNEESKTLNFWKTLSMAKVDLLGNDCPKCFKEYLGNTNKENCNK